MMIKLIKNRGLLLYLGVVFFYLLYGTLVFGENKSLKGSDTKNIKESEQLIHSQDESESKTISIKQSDNIISKKIIAYYFHGTARCANCRKIEAYSNEAIKEGFPDELKNGLIKWEVVNVDLPANKHFINDYQLFTRSVVLVEMENGKQTKWENLGDVWSYLSDKDQFKKYVQEEVSAFLKEKE